MLNGVSATTYPTTVRCEGGTDWAARMLSGVSPVSGILWRRLGRKPRLAQMQWGYTTMLFSNSSAACTVSSSRAGGKSRRSFGNTRWSCATTNPAAWSTSTSNKPIS